MKDLKDSMEKAIAQTLVPCSDKVTTIYRQSSSNEKSPDRARMETIFKNVLMMLKQANPYAVSQFNSEDLNFYVTVYLERFGIDLCEKVYYNKIQNGICFSQEKKPYLQTFMDACNHQLQLDMQKIQEEKDFRFTQIKKSTNIKLSLKDILKQHMEGNVNG